MEKIFYLAQIFGNLHTVGVVIFIISMFALVFAFVFWACTADNDSEEEEHHAAWKVITLSLYPLLISLLVMTFVPKEKTYLLMVGGRTVDHAIQSNPEIKELPGKTLHLLNEYIEAETIKIQRDNGTQKVSEGTKEEKSNEVK